MTACRVTLVTLFFLALSSIANAATMSPTFEKSLGERLAKRKASLDAYPKLKYSTYIPETVDIWRIISQSQLSETIRVFKGSVEISVPYVLKNNPGDAATIGQFTKDCNDFIAFYEAGVQSGDISDKTTAPPATAPPTTRPPRTFAPTTTSPPTTTRPATTRATASPSAKTSGGSGSDDDNAWDVGTPYSYTPYSYSPSPTYPSFDYYPSYSTPSPQYVYYGYHTTTRFSAWKICLIVLSIVIFLARVIYWANQRHAKEEKKKEEEAAAAAALQVEAGEASHATYVVIRPTENEAHTAGAPVKV